jgi:alpha-ribazole phosphatase/probable phosphoglycerate mutase
MPESTVYIVRHGTTESNKEGVYAGWSEEGLAEEGIQEAERLGLEVRAWGITAIYASPLRRALQTACILNRYIRRGLLIEPDLKEMKMGPWEGMSEEEVARRYPSEYETWLMRPSELRLKGRETLAELQQRAVRAVYRISAKHRGGATLLVSHVAPIRCLFLHFNRLPVNSYKGVSVPNLSIHRLLPRQPATRMERIR